MTYKEADAILSGFAVEEKKYKRLEADAARWRYVRDYLMQMSDARMDGKHYWRFPGRGIRGNTKDEAIDALMEQEKK